MNRENISPTAEDYLEAVYLLSPKGKSVRLKDLAEKMGVRMPSALEFTEGLKLRGFLRHERYGGIELTGQGLKIAKDVYRRHRGLKLFLTSVLGIKEDIAEIDACQIEHCLSTQTIDRIAAFTKFLNDCPRGKSLCIERFGSDEPRTSTTNGHCVRDFKK